MSEIYTLNFPGEPPFVPTINIDIHKSKFDVGYTKELGNIVNLERENILANTPRPDPGKPLTWLTGRMWDYNFFDFKYEAVDKFREFVAEQFVDYVTKIGGKIEPVYVHCWANYMKFNQSISWHNHSNAHYDSKKRFSYASANFCVQTYNTATVFRSPFFGGSIYSREDVVETERVMNIDGELIMFPSYVFHRTEENPSTEPRITIAMDIITEEVYNEIGKKPMFRKLL